MSLYEERYREWCERMTAKAALERSGAEAAGAEPALGNIETPSKDASDCESFHSTHSRQARKYATPKPIRRRTMSEAKAHISENIFPQARTDTWPRSARTSVSHTKPAVPQPQNSHFSATSCRRPDLLAFHRESCQLFSSMDASIADSGYSSIHRAGSSRLASTASITQTSTPTDASPRCSIGVTRPTLSTVTSWKSEETRRIEYDRIDRAHSGFRGLSRKLLPKFCQSKRCWRNFFSGKCDGDSVRRYRMPFSDGEEEDGS